jgi:tripartite-type tricarboxylate transporter receptor subunit TctC
MATDLDIEISRRSLMKGAVGMALGATAWAAAQAQADLGHVILGFPAGAGLDPFARILADKLRGAYLPNVIVENHPGAGGRIALESLKRAPKDGSYLIITPASALVLAPYTTRQVPYDPLADFEPVTTVLVYRMGLQVGPGAPGVKTVADYVAWVRKNPGKATFGTPGTGTMQQFLGEMFQRDAGVSLQDIPYRGAPPLYQDLISGQIPAVFTPIGGDSIERDKAGTTKILAIASPARARELPDVPTFAELGYKDLVLSEWIGVFVPAGTPPQVIDRLGAEIKRALATPEMTTWASTGQLIATSTPAELRERLVNELGYWKRVVAEFGYVPTD